MLDSDIIRARAGRLGAYEPTPTQMRLHTEAMERRARLSGRQAPAHQPAEPASVVEQPSRLHEALERMRELTSRPSEPESAEERRLFADPIRYVLDGAPRRMTMHLVAQEVAAKHGIRVTEMKSATRVKHVVAARQEAMYRMRHEVLAAGAPISFERIGHFFSGRDHTTAFHSVRRYQQKIDRGEV
jgi:chromosomal replication initiation ATPase DnaA